MIWNIKIKLGRQRTGPQRPINQLSKPHITKKAITWITKPITPRQISENHRKYIKETKP